MRAGINRHRHLDSRGAADHSLCVRLAAVRAGIPAFLLLLPWCLLPRVLAVARRLRGARAARLVLRRDEDAADRAEPAPLLLLRGVPGRGGAHLGRGAGVPWS